MPSITAPGGAVFACYDDFYLRQELLGYPGRRKFFGLDSRADIRAENIKLDGLISRFDCFAENLFVANFELPLAGRHNVSNALAAIGLGLELGVDLKFIHKALSGYKGSGRRMEIKFRSDKYTVIDDYAHHPAEIKATLEAVKNIKAKRRIGVFQPHRYTRTKLLLDEFVNSFGALDIAVITDIYPASEPRIPGVDAQLLLKRIKEYAPEKEVLFLPKDEILGYLLKIITPGDLVITLGAGDIVKVSDALAVELKEKD